LYKDLGQESERVLAHTDIDWLKRHAVLESKRIKGKRMGSRNKRRSPFERFATLEVGTKIVDAKKCQLNEADTI